MNSLSWMIYAAEVLGRAQNVSSAIAFFSTVFYAVGVYRTMTSEAARTIRRLWFIPAISGMIAIFTPSSNTIYLMAGSEAGETIVTDPEMKEVFSDLKTIIKAKIKEQLPSTE